MIRRGQYEFAADPTAQTERAVQAAIRFQAQRQYQQDLASGMSPNEALAKAAPLMFSKPPPAMTPYQAEEIALRKAQAAKVPTMTPYQAEEIKLRREQAAAKAGLTPKLSETEKALLGADVTELKGIEKQLGGTEEHGFGVLHPFGGNKSQMDALRQKAAELRKKIQTEYGGKAKTATMQAAPRSAKDRVAGRTYQTPKGPHTWTGNGWKLAEDTSTPDAE
jgi:hypothetical protein